ncbi:MAG: hypothetical protein WC924_00440 [Candidatus Gracilibacteria bacterium]
MENSNEMSVSQALNQVQSWLNASEYDKVIQGCQEILQLEPGNVRALSLMRQAEERRHSELTKEEKLQEAPAVEPKEPEPNESEVFLPEEEDENSEKRKLFLAMLIPAIAVVLIGGSVIWWLANRERTEIIDNNLTDGGSSEELTYLEENDQRVEDMEKMTKVLETYKQENGVYPSLSQVESVLVQSDIIGEIPSDPRQGEIDKAGQAFGYIYAIYDGIGGKNSVYILSALFEDNAGFGTPWAQGATIKNYPNYREYEEVNVTFIGGDEDEVTKGGKGPSDDKNSDSEPKVNPNN